MRHTVFFFTALLGFCLLLLALAFAPCLRAGSINDTIWTKRLSGDIDNIAFSANGTKLFTPAGDSLHILDAATGIALRSYHFGICYYQHYADSEQNCVYFSNVDSSFHKRSLSDEKELKVIYMPGSSLFSTCSYTPDARYAIITTNIPYRSGIDNHLPLGIGWRVVDMQSGEIRQRKEYPIKINELGADIRKVYLDPTGDTAIVEVHRSYGDGQGHWSYADDIILYSVATGDSIGRYRLPFENTFQSPDGSRIAVLYNNLVTIVQAGTGKSIAQININSTGLSDISLSQDQGYLVVGRGSPAHTIELWNITSNKLIWQDKGTSFQVVRIYDDIVAGSAGNYLAVYKLPSFTSVINDIQEKSNLLYPNPTTGELRLQYTLQKEGEISYFISNTQGETVENLKVGIQEVGKHILRLSTAALPSGTYLLRFQSPDGVQSYTFTLTK